VHEIRGKGEGEGGIKGNGGRERKGGKMEEEKVDV
jgi:hypothetical protein